MNYLLDAHAFIWALVEPERLSDNVHAILEDSKNQVFVSAVTFWEISLKIGLGKLELKGATPNDLPRLALDADFSLLSLLPEEAASYHSLEATWRKDPFDRMLMQQAINQRLTLLSKGRNIARYQSPNLKVIW
jgi:PIN domain nuclease of toxin-antitoxin system